MILNSQTTTKCLQSFHNTTLTVSSVVICKLLYYCYYYSNLYSAESPCESEALTASLHI